MCYVYDLVCLGMFTTTEGDKQVFTMKYNVYNHDKTKRLLTKMDSERMMQCCAMRAVAATGPDAGYRAHWITRHASRKTKLGPGFSQQL